MDKRKATPRVTPRVTKEEVAHMRALRAKGMPMWQIAELTKRSLSTVKTYTEPPPKPVVAPYVPTLPPQDGIIARIRKWIFGV